MTSTTSNSHAGSCACEVIQLAPVGKKQAMADHNSSMESGSSADETSSVVHPGTANACETSMWEGWTQASNGDEVSTSSLLPELSSSCRSSPFHQSDMFSSWLSASFHPLSHNTFAPDLAHNPDPADHPPAFMQEGLVVDHDHSLADTYIRYNSKHSAGSLYSHDHSEPKRPDSSYHKTREDSSQSLYGKSVTAPYQLLQSLGPESPSSPLALHNGLLHSSFGDTWDGSPPTLSWSVAPPHGTRGLVPDHSPSAINHLEGLSTRYGARLSHTEVFADPDGNFVSTPAGWAPPYKYHQGEIAGSSVRPLKLMASLREARETNSMCSESNLTGLCQEMDFLSREDRSSTAGSPFSSVLTDGARGESSVEQGRPAKHRLEIVEVDYEDATRPAKRPNLAIDQATALWRSNMRLRSPEPGSYTPSAGSSLASQALDIIAGPALNTNGKPRARRGSATDPQSVYARHRRERINERFKTLQHLVPNGAKVDIVTMLEEAINYVKFLQLQVKLLRSDEYWIYATPNTYNGIDISNPSLQTQGLESSA